MKMKANAQAKIKDNKMVITGYVNVPGRESRPVATRRGLVNEVIEERAFQKAIDRANNVPMIKDHDMNAILAQTADSTLKLYEDSVGVRAESTITDEKVIEAARKNKIKGWSFKMRNIEDEIEERADKLPLRRVKDFVLDEVSLIIDKFPVYSATSVECRAETEEEVELRAYDIDVEIEDIASGNKGTNKNSNFKFRNEVIRLGI